MSIVMFAIASTNQLVNCICCSHVLPIVKEDMALELNFLKYNDIGKFVVTKRI
jgi:hypothetical protein